MGEALNLDRMDLASGRGHNQNGRTGQQSKRLRRIPQTQPDRRRAKVFVGARDLTDPPQFTESLGQRGDEAV